MSVFKAAFVLVHGAWHNQSTWSAVAPLLEAQGFLVLTLDLPGAGVNTIAPAALNRHPFDAAAFAAERSPIALVTQEERTQAVVALIREAVALSDQVILVGHSAGGITVSAATEQVPELLRAVVYLSGFMLPNGMPLLAILQHPTMTAALSSGLFIGDPAAIGATRIHAGSREPAYQALLRDTFYGDVPAAPLARALAQLHCDEPAATAVTPSVMTRGRFGTVPRHYIRCTQDCAVPLGCQDHMIALVDAALGSDTSVHTLHSSHSPFLSQPATLATRLAGICASLAP